MEQKSNVKMPYEAPTSFELRLFATRSICQTSKLYDAQRPGDPGAPGGGLGENDPIGF